MEPLYPNSSRLENSAADLLQSLFERDGWQVSQPGAAPTFVNMTLIKGPLRYVMEMKTATESRRDRLLPILSQAILTARGRAAQSPQHRPLAIVVTNHVSEASLRAFCSFHHEFAHETAVGLIDQAGFRWFAGAGLEHLNTGDPQPREENIRPTPTALFSDLNQWLLKVLLAPEIAPDLLNAPRALYRSATQLAIAADVSVMTATRFLKQFMEEDLLVQKTRSYHLVRRRYLFERWQAVYANPTSDVSARWLLSSKRRLRFGDALRESLEISERQGGRNHRLCVGLFAAADELGAGFVHGAPPYLFLDSIEPKFLRDIGISILEKTEGPDMFLQVPAASQSVFRAAIARNGLWVSDILQTWLDVSSHPTRGKEQAETIRHRFLQNIFRES